MDPFHDYRFWMCVTVLLLATLIYMTSEQQANAQRIWNYCTENYSVEYAKNYCGIQPYLASQKEIARPGPFAWAESLANGSIS